MLYSILKVHSSSIDAASAYDADATRDTGTGDTSNDQTKWVPLNMCDYCEWCV